ncbi:spore coat protein U domain-containing protein [Moraxellaceae bacterium AER2_44_116]|nr:spore coat protein U domain-containing protein [Moraxellaceae bacterium]TQC96120.1 spore coat protein U domain-containing protein [Moraxellaceae bacterium AER2_44_116]
MKTTKLMSRVALVSALAITGLNVNAATVTDNLAVSATVIANCSIDAATTPLAFGNYDAVVANASTPKDAAASVDVTCTDGAVGVTLSAGNGTAFSGTRRMSSGANRLPYELFSDAGRTAAFAAEPVTADGSLQTIDVYGRIPAANTAPVGAYTDTLVMTVTF